MDQGPGHCATLTRLIYYNFSILRKMTVKNLQKRRTTLWYEADDTTRHGNEGTLKLDDIFVKVLIEGWQPPC